jgi:hypothetical protein
MAVTMPNHDLLGVDSAWEAALCPVVITGMGVLACNGMGREAYLVGVEGGAIGDTPGVAV